MGMKMSLLNFSSIVESYKSRCRDDRVFLAWSPHFSAGACGAFLTEEFKTHFTIKNMQRTSGARTGSLTKVKAVTPNTL